MHDSDLWVEWAREQDSRAESRAPSETETALMAADELVEYLERFEVPRRSTAWAADVRARIESLDLDLEIVELSDALEHAGRPRLSESTDNQRYFAPLWTMSSAGKQALEAVRAERKALLVEVTASKQREALRRVRASLGLKNKPPRQWRLGELREVAWHLRELPAVQCEQCGRASRTAVCVCGWHHRREP